MGYKDRGLIKKYTGESIDDDEPDYINQITNKLGQLK
ncbi:hypothetical protein CPS_3742 [Colwellia psychrerythraea 34H]|uniref:Uncharacterized protein n=1 Tax=Colwellia psychrerythraea (strain 34H / ATCC BAA-681) TaxID=167879 RepID=Q47XR1_COLP3|nr:hypothetical protein CPS_3742 [Colwellia psychrerythraea 34H]